MAIERPHLFDGSLGRLFGVYHVPHESNKRPIVMCHAFGEEKLWAHRVFVNQARRLAREGHQVLRFDFAGNGDSDGDFQQSSLETARVDVASAVHHLKNLSGSEQVVLLGLRLGATTAWQVAAASNDIAALVLWEPVLDGRRYAQDLLRINLATQLAVFREVRQPSEVLLKGFDEGRSINVEGYELSKEFFGQLIATDRSSLGAPAKPALIVQVDRATSPIRPPLAEIALGSTNVQVEAVVEEYFWKECRAFCNDAPNLADVTTAWLSTS